MTLQIVELTRRFPGMRRPAVDHVTFSVDTGEIVALAGASGSGKTTTLRLIAGFDDPDGGSIYLGDRAVVSGRGALPPERRNIGVVFQEFALFPHLTVFENIAFGINKRAGVERSKRVEYLLSTAGISSLAARYPHEISGGQQQRVAVARALAPQPAILLLDEPFSNLDHTCTHRLLSETRSIIKENGAGAIVVSHDRYEAFTLADRIAVLNHGKIDQIGTAEEIFTTPRTREVAEFSGSVSWLPVWRTSDRWDSPLGPVPDDVAVVESNGSALASDRSAYAAVRPHQIAVGSARLEMHAINAKETATSTGRRASVLETRFLGAVSAVRLAMNVCDSTGERDVELLAHLTAASRPFRRGERVRVEWSSATGSGHR